MSVIVATYDEDYYDYIYDCVESILLQDYSNFELLIVTGNNNIKKKINEDFQDRRIRIIDFKGEGISEARNKGAESSTGEYLVFTDDDVIVEKDWLSSIKEVYDEKSCLGVSGKVIPRWEGEKYREIPEEFYWLIGATHKGYGEKEIVRNSFGPNMSFKKNLFEKIDGFDENLGKEKNYMMQGEESEFGSRLRQELGEGVYYEPEIKVYHRIEKRQTKLKNLLVRSFYQGYSKGYMSDNTFRTKLEKEEVNFLKRLIKRYIPKHIKELEIKKTLLSIFLTFMVFLGFIYYKVFN